MKKKKKEGEIKKEQKGGREMYPKNKANFFDNFQCFFRLMEFQLFKLVYLLFISYSAVLFFPLLSFDSRDKGISGEIQLRLGRILVATVFYTYRER